MIEIFIVEEWIAYEGSITLSVWSSELLAQAELDRLQRLEPKNILRGYKMDSFMLDQRNYE